MEMTGKTVLITGASRGIGEAAARVFAQAGANVALLARSGDEIRRIAKEIGPAATAITCDVRDYASVSAAVAQTVDTFGGLDVYVGNAGVVEPICHMADAVPDDWDRAIDINLKGVFYGMRAALPLMLSQGGGTIMTVSSGAAYRPVDGWSAYCASKAGAYMLTQLLHLEYGDKGIRAIGLSPGTVATKMQRQIKETGLGAPAKLNWSDHIPAEWPARTLLWMCQSDADEFLGQDVQLRDPVMRSRIGLT